MFTFTSLSSEYICPNILDHNLISHKELSSVYLEERADFSPNPLEMKWTLWQTQKQSFTVVLWSSYSEKTRTCKGGFFATVVHSGFFPKKLKIWLKTQTTILFKLFVKFYVHRQTVLYYVNMSIKRNNRFQMFLKVSVLKNFCNIHRKTLLLEPLFNKVASLQACNFIKKRLQHRCFPMNITKFFGKAFYRTPLVAASA